MKLPPRVPRVIEIWPLTWELTAFISFSAEPLQNLRASPLCVNTKSRAVTRDVFQLTTSPSVASAPPLAYEVVVVNGNERRRWISDEEVLNTHKMKYRSA